jgi:hypothetical protein
MPSQLSRPDKLSNAEFGVDSNVRQDHVWCQHLSMPELKPKKGELLRNWIDFLFGFENKRGDVLDSWIFFADTFSFPPQEFYAAIEKELTARKIPTMEMSREDFSEGGPLSDKRIYLRMFRERLAIYTCAAPFGIGYFFSCRTVYVPALVRLWHILAAFMFLSIVGRIFLPPLGFTFTVISLVALVFAIAGVLRNAAGTAQVNLDAILLRIPVISTFYQDWFRDDTFYRLDTRLLYLKQVPAIVRALADDVAAANGVKLVNQNDSTPILAQLHRPPRPPTQPEKA